MTETLPKKRGYTLTEAAIEQRRAAAAQSTGPRTEEGKAASSRNAWKTGEFSRLNQLHLQNVAVGGAFGRPCRTTCPKHPQNPHGAPEFPCTLVLDKLTEAGKDCLDKAVYVDMLTAVIRGIESGEYNEANSAVAAHLAGAIEMLHGMREAIADKGLLIEQPVYGKDGQLVGHTVVVNPLIPHYTKLLGELGVNLPEMLSTPKSREKLIDPTDPEDPVMAMFQQIAGRAAGNGPVRRGADVLDAEFREVPARGPDAGDGDDKS